MKAIERWSVITLKRQATKKWLHLRTASTIAAALFNAGVLKLTFSQRSRKKC